MNKEKELTNDELQTVSGGMTLSVQNAARIASQRLFGKDKLLKEKSSFLDDERK